VPKSILVEISDEERTAAAGPAAARAVWLPACPPELVKVALGFI